MFSTEVQCQGRSVWCSGAPKKVSWRGEHAKEAAKLNDLDISTSTAATRVDSPEELLGVFTAEDLDSNARH